MSTHPTQPSSQLFLPGLSEVPVHEGGEQLDRPWGPAPRRPAASPIGSLKLPPVSSFDSADALTAAIAQLEPYLAELKRRRGNLPALKRGAMVQAAKRPNLLELEAFFPDVPRHHVELGRAG